MKATIKIEFNNSNYDHVKTILEALQQSVDSFDAIYGNEPNGKVRTVKGKPQFSPTENNFYLTNRASSSDGE